MNLNYEAVQDSFIFKDIKAEELESMLSCMDGLVRSYKKGEIIQTEDSPVGKMGMILSGNVQIVREDYFGNRNILEQLSEGELYGAAYSLAGITKSQVSIIALTDCEIMQMDAGKILNICPSGCPHHQTLLKNLIRILARKNVLLGEKITHLSKRSTREKLLSYLSEESKKKGNSHFVIPFNRQELADYLCVERSAMSAELGKLKKEGILDFNRSEFWMK